MIFPHGWTVQVIRMGGRDRDGDRLPDSTHELHGVAVAPAMSNRGSSSFGVDGVEQADAIAVSARLYAPMGADIRPGDRVVSRGVQYRVAGSPRRWQFVFTGGAAGCVCDLEEVQSSGKVLG